MWNPRKTLVLHNSRETLARLLNRRIRHLCTTYKMQNVATTIPSMLLCMVPGVSLKMIQDDRIWQSYMQCGMMLWHLLTSFFALSLLLKAYSLFFMATFAQCTNQDSNCVYVGRNLRHTRWYDTKMIPIWYGMYAMEGVERWSLMCTSNVAGNTQRLVLIGKWRKMG